MEFPPRDEEANENNNNNSNNTSTAAPSVIDDEELITREKEEALLTLHEAVWSVSSAKHGNGVNCLLDNSHNTFWQSDGVLPHIISIDFARLVPVSAVAIYLDFQQDESYTPRKIKIQAGTHSGDIADVANIIVEDPQGWVFVRVNTEKEEEIDININTNININTESSWDNGGNQRREIHQNKTGREKKKTSASPTINPSLLLATALGSDDHAEFIEEGVWCTHLRIVLEENRQNGRDCHVRGLRVLGPAQQSIFTTATFKQNLVLR